MELTSHKMYFVHLAYQYKFAQKNKVISVINSGLYEVHKMCLHSARLEA